MSTKLDRLLMEQTAPDERLRFRVNGTEVAEFTQGNLNHGSVVEKEDLPAYLEWLTDLLTEEKTDPRSRPAPLPFSTGETAHDRYRRWTYNDRIK
jgi:hypothetical protein